MASGVESSGGVQGSQEDWEDFGQKVDLTQRIREVLQNYPEGTTILKELIQNADDSGASKVIVCLDRRHHGTGRLAYSGLAPFQGPALLVYNNSIFTEEDFESISRVGGSKKRTQAGKTGRFGIGFNVVYHLTDLPSFVSGQHLVYFDPHCAHLPRVNAANPGKRLDFVRAPAGDSQRDQFAPYKVFGCDMARPFNGTLFRFPLRTPDLAAVSRISRQAYSVQGMSELLAEFRAEAVPSLLFLKHVESIELFDWATDAAAPTKLFTCELENTGPEIHRHRQVFSQIARSPLPRTPISDVFALEFRSRDELNGGEETHESYLISQYMAGSQSAIGAIKSRAEKEYDLHLLPWTSIAARLDSEDDAQSSSPLKGRAFCFLPLPMTTDLPVHVNGYFELSSNRRDLWMGLDMEGSGRLRSEWNRTLLSDVCTAAYAQLLLRATTQLGPSSAYDALLPANKPAEPWSILVTKLYQALADIPILHTRAVDAGARRSDGGAAAGRWITPREALFRDEEFARGAALTSALVSEGLPVVEPPLGARTLLMEHATAGQATVCTSALVRAHLRGSGVHRGLERRENALTLLEYCLEDVLDDEAGDHLVNLQLVPLSDGTLGRFARRSEPSGTSQQFEPSGTDFVLPASELEARLLGGVPHRVVDEKVEGQLGERLRSIAESGGTNVRILSAPILGQLLSEILPREWRGKRHVAWEVLGANAELDPSEQERELRLFTQRDELLRAQSGRRVSGALVVELSRQPSVNWLSDFWQWLGEKSRGDVRTFSDWPLLPTSDGGLCQLSLSSAVVGPGWEVLESGTGGFPSGGSAEKTGSLSGDAGATLTEGNKQPEGQSRSNNGSTGASDGSSLRGLVKVLKKLGCRFLHPREAISVSEHPLASQFLHTPTAIGILTALSAACESDGAGLVSQRVAKLDVLERASLRRFFTQPQWWSGAPVQTSSVNILRSLPIFETYGSSPGGLVALASSRVFLPPKDVDEALLGESFLKPASETEAHTLAGSLGVPVLGRAAFYRAHVFGRILGLPADVRNKSMLAALRDLPGLCSEDASFREIISRLPFVPAGGRNGDELLPPSALYDPRVEELVLLLEGARSRGGKEPPAGETTKTDAASNGESSRRESQEGSEEKRVLPTSSGFFPRGEFATPQVLDALRFLGLKTSVSQETVLAAARAVEQLAGSDPDTALFQGRAILEYLEIHGQRWTPGAGEEVRKAFSKFGNYLGIKEARASETGLEKFWSDLGSTQWCPVMVTPPDPSLPWPSVTGTVSAPRFCRPASDMWLVSASLRVLDGECRSAALAHQLGWDKSPGPAVLAAQLLELGKRHAHVGGRAVGRQLAAAIPRIYTLLHQLLGREEMDIVKAVLEGSAWVWVGDGFAAVDQVAFTGPLNLAPYFFVIPSDLSAFRELLSELGVRDGLAPGDYARVLARMAADTAGNPLQDAQLSMAIWLVQQLADAHLLAEDAGSGIHVPDAAGVLAPAGELVYNDAPWLEGFGGGAGLAPAATASSSRFVHAKVSHEVAERVGVRSLRRLLLAANADSMDLAVGAAEAFGQHEALTVRLKHIVEMYADGPGILCELVQNADDAGATSVAIVLDRERYGASSILSPRMAAWQGPALLCYNDAQFTPRDLHNISRIGQDSKLEKPAAIGRFGLGFNSVYHLTDVPSFVSGEYLVIFDPHASHLPGVSPSHPGLKIGFVGRGLPQQFPDQFLPYMRFGCDLQHRFPGTLFRFPLRSPEAARKSEIKQEPCDLVALTELLYSFRSTATEALLFLRSVRSISVYIRDPPSEPPANPSEARLNPSENLELLYKVERAPSLQEDPQQAILSFIRGGGRDVVASKDAFLLRLQRAAENALPGGCAKVDILTTGPPRNEDSPSPTAPVHTAPNKPVSDGGEAHQVNADVAAVVSGSGSNKERIETERAGQSWLVCNRLGGGRARAHALAPEARGRGFVPWAGVAARLDAEIAGRAFCFLPLPVTTHLPVHTNGYFELSSNRRDIWQGTDHLGTRSNIKSEWNTCLLEDVAAPAYAQLLVHAAKQLGPTPEYSRLWPVGDLRDPWGRMAGKLYEAVVDLPVLPTKAGGGLGRWITPRQAVFPDFSFGDMGPLGAALVAAGMPLVDVSPEVCVKFQQSCPSLRYLTPQLLRRQLAIAGGRKPKLTDRATVVLALKYCLQGLDDTPPGDLLLGLPLLPLADGSLGTFGRPSEGPIYLATPEEYTLFASKVPRLFLEQGPIVFEDTRKVLEGLAEGGGTNLRVLSAADVASSLLPRILPAGWERRVEVEWRPPADAEGFAEGLDEPEGAVSDNTDGGLSGHPSAEWMTAFWKWLGAKGGLELFTAWPLIPTSGGLLCKPLEINPAPGSEDGVNLDPERKPYSVVVRGEALNEGVVGLLVTARCQLVRTEIVGTNPVLNQFVHGSTAAGVLGALSEAASRKRSPLTELLERATPSQKQETRAFLCQSKWFIQSGASALEPQRTGSAPGSSLMAGDSLSTVHLRILAALPIFEAYTGAETTSASVNRLFVDLASKPRFFPPPGVPESLLSVNFLRCENESERTLLERHLGVESLGRAAFFSDHVFGRPEVLSTDVGRRAMLAVLKDLPTLAAENPELSPKLTRLAFVPTGAGTLAAPADLYDPGVNELHMLLDRGAFFPSEEFQRPEVLEVLRGLGLRRAMGRKGLLDSARSVEMRAGSDVREAVKRGRALLQHLDDLELGAEGHVALSGGVHTSAPPDESVAVTTLKPEHVNSVNPPPAGDAGTPSPAPENDLEESAFWVQLAGISWCPVLEESPDVRLPWRDLGGPLAPPKFVRPSEDAWLVSSGLRLLDGEVKSANLKTKLGWGGPPGASVLAGQLLELGKMHPRVEDEGLAELLGGAVLVLYTALQNVVGTEEFEVVKASLEGSNCVWVGNGFVAARSIAFESPANFHPYLYTIPSELAPHRRLLEALEVRERFASRDYAQLLFRMARDANGEPLPGEQLNVVFRVLDVLADDPGFARGTSILLPDKTGRLSRAEDLVFNDASWLAGDGETGPRLVHPDVSNEVAEKLGARSLRYMFLVDQEMTSDVPCPGLELTRAVTDEPKLVLFDLLEVADVAGARRVEICIDGREHPRQSLLQPNLAPFQGPGVVFRMDGPPLSVQELSALFAPPPTKLHGRNCTYGSALLSCFALTDLPFVASGGLLYMFDPQGDILAASPTGGNGKRNGPTGKAYSLTGTDLVTRFADQLAPLELTPGSQSGLAVNNTEGTVIRLPLRAASESQPGALTDVREAVQFFQEHLAPSLLFLRAVEEVAVKVYRPGSDSAQEVLRCSILPQHVELRQPFQDQQKKRSKFAISSLFSGQSSVVRTNRIAVRTSSAQSPQPVLDEWLVVQALGSGKTRDMSLDRKYLSLNLVPVGGVAAHVMRDGMPLPHPAVVSTESERGASREDNTANGGAEKPADASVKSSDDGKGWATFVEVEGQGQTPNGDASTSQNERASTPTDNVRDESKPESLSLDFNPSSRIPHASAVHLGLPLCAGEGLPVILSGHFLPAKTTSGRQLFQRSVNAPPHPADPQHPSPDFLRLNWNRELLLCVREAYIELLVHLHRASNPQTSQPQRVQGGNGRLEPVMVPPMTPERLYSYWPRFTIAALTGQPDDSVLAETLVRPMYGLLAQLPLFLLQTGVRAKIGEGMFLAPPAVQERQGVVPPASVLQFLHQHYQVFAVPWEIRDELHGAGVSTSDLTPKMLRSLLRSPTAAVHQLPDPRQALLTQVDLLEYCCTDLVLKPDPLALESAPDQNGVSGPTAAASANGGERLPRAEELGRGEQEAAIRAQAAELRRITQGPTGAVGGPPRGVALVSQSAFAPDIDRLFGAGSARAADTFVASIAGAIAAGGGSGAQANGPPARRAPDAPTEGVVRDADGNVVRIDGQKVTELIGVRCPAASGEMFRLGGEAFLASPAQENLLPGLAPKFVHSLAAQRGSLSLLFSHPQFRGALNLKVFTQQLLAANLGSALPKVWAIRGTPVIVPWDSHPHALPSAPSPDWLKRLWREVGANGEAPRGGAGSAPVVAHLLDGGMFGRWHLLPAVQGAQTVLVRGDQKDLVFYPPAELDDNGPFLRDLGASEAPSDAQSDSEEETEPLLDPRRNTDRTSSSQVASNGIPADGSGLDDVSNPHDVSPTADVSTSVDASARRAPNTGIETAVRYPRLATAHPWLLPLLRSMGVPVFDTRFRGVCERLVKPPPGKDVAQLLLARLGALQQARVLDVTSLTLNPQDCDSLVSLFAASYGPDRYTPADVTLLKSLPIYKTAHTGDHVSLPAGGPNPYCTVPPGMFLKPRERVLEYRSDAGGLFAALGVKELTDADVMAEHALPEFGVRSREEQDRTLGQLRTHWARLKQVPAVVAALKETAFVLSAGPSPDGTERSLHKPSDLLDPSNTLLRRVFFDEPERFAGGEFASERWLPILRDAGLRSSMDGSLYLECGKKIEARATGEVRPSAAVLPPVVTEESRFRRTDNRALVSANPAEAEVENAGTDRELLEIAGLLIEKMLGEFANVFGPAFCEAFSQIGCVPAERIVFKDVRTGRGGARTTEVRTVLASYQESVLTKDWALAWSSAPVLKDERVVPPAFAWGALKLRSPPAYATVVAHLKTLGQNGGEDVLARWGGITGARTAGGHVSVEDAFLAIFRFLDSKWDGLSVSERGLLKGVPFIPVANGTRLVAPDRLYARARTDLAPFAFELPRLFTPYLRVLEGLGTGDAPTPEGLLKLIAEVAHASGGERLNPNELHAVLRILTLASEELGNVRSRGPAVRTERIVVPDEGARLRTLNDVICADAAGASLVNEIDGRKVRLTHPLLLEEVAARLGVRKLSESVEEELDQAWFPEQLPSLGTFSRDHLAARLQSPNFVNAATALVHSHAAVVPTLRQVTRRHVAAALASAAEGLRLVKALSTRLVLLPGREDVTLREEWPEASQPEVEVERMVDRAPETTSLSERRTEDAEGAGGSEPTESHTLITRDSESAQGEPGPLTGPQSRAYSTVPTHDDVPPRGGSQASHQKSPTPTATQEPLAHTPPRQRTVYEFFDQRSGMLFIAAPPPYLPLQELFSGALSRLLGSPVPLPLGALLFAPPGDVIPLCRALRVPLQEMTDEEGARQRDAQRSGAPGEKLLPEDLPLVQCHPLRPYHAGEVVAWQPGPSESGVLRYGRIAQDVRAPSGQALYYVALETHPGQVQDLLSSAVFSFRSASSPDGGPVSGTATHSLGHMSSPAASTGPVAPGAEASGAAVNGTAGRATATAGVATATAGVATATAGGERATAGRARATAGSAPVKPAEVVQAVADMLAAADLPLGLEEGALMERALGLQEQLGAAETLLEGAETRVREAQREVEAAKTAWTCKVCLGEEVTSALVPCGHLFCTTCGVGVGGRCPFCRRPVSSILRIYKP